MQNNRLLSCRLIFASSFLLHAVFWTSASEAQRIMLLNRNVQAVAETETPQGLSKVAIPGCLTITSEKTLAADHPLYSAPTFDYVSHRLTIVIPTGGTTTWPLELSAEGKDDVLKRVEEAAKKSRISILPSSDEKCPG